ncbi:MAG: preprotein translocase subunit SecA [Motiliproteus sp.]
MESSASLRPGLVLGRYPQRDESPSGRLDRAASRISGFLRQSVLPSRLSRFSDITRSVDRQGEALVDLSDAQLAAEVVELRQCLSIDGLTDGAIARAFAIVREVSSRTLGLRHFDAQLIGGWVMMMGQVAEMQTGEGKTLTATLPACTAALSGIPVHVVTVNDYLVQRDAEWMSPIYRALGLSVGMIVEGMSAEDRRAAYACDVTYCTNKQLVFDYLKDRLVMGSNSGCIRFELDGLCNGGAKNAQVLLRGLCFAIVDEADSVLVDEARTPLIISRPADSFEEGTIYKQALSIAAELLSGVDFKLRDQDRIVDLTDQGREKLRDYAETIGGLWLGVKRRENYIRQALSALNLFVCDTHYLIKEGKVQIIDEYTGRVMPDRSWEQGLHQMIEAKEGCDITSQPETLARISYQRFFRRYLRLSGMTGTAKEISGELWSTYRLGTVSVPTHKPLHRVNYGCRVYPTAETKWKLILSRIQQIRTLGRPVLVGTRSVGASEHLSAMLSEVDIPHEVLNARQDRNEAEIIAKAGEAGHVTVATNMAGRGTDIHLAPGVSEIGGLHVIATERHEARRIDRQLFGRSGRQGDRGSFEYILSLDDEIVTNYSPHWLLGCVESNNDLPVNLAGRMTVSLAQWLAERKHSQIRRDLLKMDEYLSSMLSYSGQPE